MPCWHPSGVFIQIMMIRLTTLKTWICRPLDKHPWHTKVAAPRPAALGVLRAVHSASLRMDAAMGRWRALTRAATRRRREQRPPDPERTTGTRDPAQCPLECPQHAAWACTHDHHRHYAVAAIPIATGCERFTRWRGIALFSSFIVVSATNSPELIFAALGGQRPVRSALSAHTDHCEF